MAEAYGLDRRIRSYRGTRPLTLYRCDLECLLDVLTDALTHPRTFPPPDAPTRAALQSLRDRLQREYDEA